MENQPVKYYRLQEAVDRTNIIIMREFHLWQSVISKPEVITSFGAYIDVCYKIENYEVTHLSSMSSCGCYLVISVE